jgi:hypothetical protein
MPQVGDLVVILHCGSCVDKVTGIDGEMLKFHHHADRRIDKEGIEWRFATPEEVVAGRALP